MQLKKIELPKDIAILTGPLAKISDDHDSLIQYLPVINDLIAAHQHYKGVGLAAPQVGIALPIVVVEISAEQASLRDNARAFDLCVFINPEYVGIEESEIVSDMEACLSVDHVAGWVPRFKCIQFKATRYDPITQNLHCIDSVFEGFLARVLQHETDHINGILISHRLKPECEQGTLKAMLQLRRDRLPIEKQKLLDELIIRQKR